MKKKNNHSGNMYTAFSEDELWVIKETEWVKHIQNIRESQLALGNGFIGSRGVMEEIPYDSRPGTYVAGIYDKLTAQVSEVVNLPNPFNFKFSVGGEKIGANSMDIVRHRRALNMKKGVIARHTVYKDSKGHRFDYQSVRFISMHNKNVGVMQIALTALDKDCTVDITTGIDTSVYNTGTLTEGRKKHFRVKELGQKSNAGYLVVETFEKKNTIVYWCGFSYKYNGKKAYAKDNVFKIKLKKGKKIVFTKVCYIDSFAPSKTHSKQKENSFKKFYRAFHADYEVLLSNHVNEWEKIWSVSDVAIKGTANLQINMRFNLYHMLICAHADKGVSSIGARTLSGEGYRGHIFWDAEIFLMPFYLYTNPKVAKNMLLYRYNRLEQARIIAKERGYKGAMFPWESAASGFDETPTWAKDINGKIVKIHTNNLEQHITPDIAYGVYKYYQATKDEKFMRDCGYEMLFETARFCCSRFELNKKKGYYEIKNIIGPDEFHVGVNNNVYTNVMFKWNLTEAVKVFEELQNGPKTVLNKVTKKIKLKESEVKKWKRTAAKVKEMNINPDGVIEQFDGYFKLKDVNFEEMDENGIPILPKELGTTDMEKTQFIKQGDVVVLMYLLPELFDQEKLKANHLYYVQKTAHKSSLSPSINSLIACRAGDLYRAYHLFNVSLRADISNLYGNTHEGAHAASLGGTYQALIFGFAGLRIRNGQLYITPRLPRTWDCLVFSFYWQGRLMKFEIASGLVKVKIKSTKKGKIKIIVFGEEQELSCNKSYSFTRESNKPGVEFYY